VTEKNHNLQQLPKGWAWTQLGDIYLDRSRAIVPNKMPEEMFELYSVPSFDNGEPEIVSGKEIGSNKQVVEEGAVLLCKINPRINRVWMVGNHSSYMKIASTEWIPFFGQEEISPKYLIYFMRNSDFRAFLSLHVSGVGGSLMRIKVSTIAKYPIPLAPFNEQKRIVGRLEELFARLDAGVEGLRKVKAQLKRYRQAVLKYAFEGKLTEEWRKTHKDQIEPASKLLEQIRQERLMNLKKNKKLSPMGSFELPALPESWMWMRADWLCDVQTGPFGTQLHRNDYTSSGIPAIEIGDVHPTRDLREGTAHFIAKEKAIELKRFEVKHGDVLFSRVGTVGRCTIVPEGCDGWIMSTSLIRVRIVSKYLLPKHLLLYFWSPIAQGFAKRTSKGTTRAGTNSRIVGELPLIIPPIMEQQIIVEEIERRLTEVDNIEQTLNQNLTRASRLRQSILKIAFEGKLVPQDPSDEPADKLLERIKEERAKSKGEKDTNKGRKNMHRQLELSTYVK